MKTQKPNKLRILLLGVLVITALTMISCDDKPDVPADLLAKLEEQDSAAMRTINVTLHYNPDLVTQASAYRMLQVAQFAYRWCEHLHGEPWPESRIDLYLKSALDHETYGVEYYDRLYDNNKAVIFDAYIAGSSDPEAFRDLQNFHVITNVIHLYFQHANADLPVLLREGAVQWTMRALEPQLGWQLPLGQLYLVEDRFTGDSGVTPLETLLISLAPEYGFQSIASGDGLLAELKRVLKLAEDIEPLEPDTWYNRFSEPAEGVSYRPLRENYAMTALDFSDYIIHRFSPRQYVQLQRDPANMLQILGVPDKDTLFNEFIQARMSEMGLEFSPVKMRKWQVRTDPAKYAEREEFLLAYLEQMEKDEIVMAEWQQFIARFASNPDVFFDYVTKFGAPDDFLFEGLDADDMLAMVERMEQADPESPLVRSYATFLRGQVASLNKDVAGVDAAITALKEMNDPDLKRQIDFLEDLKRVGMEYDLSLLLIEDGLDQALEANPHNYLYKFLSIYRGMFDDDVDQEKLAELFTGLEELYTMDGPSQSFKRMVLFFDAYFAMGSQDWDRAVDRLGLFDKKFGLPKEMMLSSTADILKRKVEFFQRNPNLPAWVVAMCFPM